MKYSNSKQRFLFIFLASSMLFVPSIFAKNEKKVAIIALFNGQGVLVKLPDPNITWGVRSLKKTVIESDIDVESFLEKSALKHLKKFDTRNEYKYVSYSDLGITKEKLREITLLSEEKWKEYLNALENTYAVSLPPFWSLQRIYSFPFLDRVEVELLGISKNKLDAIVLITPSYVTIPAYEDQELTICSSGLLYLYNGDISGYSTFRLSVINVDSESIVYYKDVYGIRSSNLVKKRKYLGNEQVNDIVTMVNMYISDPSKKLHQKDLPINRRLEMADIDNFRKRIDPDEAGKIDFLENYLSMVTHHEIESYATLSGEYKKSSLDSIGLAIDDAMTKAFEYISFESNKTNDEF